MAGGVNITRTLLISALLLWPPHLPAADAEVIRFKKDEVAGTVRGQVTGAIKTYQFRAREGQNITVSLARDGGDRGTLTFTLYAYCGEEFGKPLVTESIRWEGSLPCTDRYSVDVTPSTEAMQQAWLQRYVLAVTIS